MVWVVERRCGSEEHLHLLTTEQFGVLHELSRVRMQVLTDAELRRVHKDADADQVTASLGASHQVEVPTVQSAHCRHESV